MQIFILVEDKIKYFGLVLKELIVTPCLTETNRHNHFRRDALSSRYHLITILPQAYIQSPRLFLQ